MIDDLKFLESTFFSSKAYYRVGGRPVVLVFGIDHYAAADGNKTVDWAKVSGSFSGSSEPLFVFENTSHTDAAGGYAWPQPTAEADYAHSKDPFDDLSYLPGFYSSSKSHGLDLSFGLGFKGFDDHLVNGWVSMKTPAEAFVDGERYIGSSAARTWLDAFKLASTNASSIAGVQLATWDDYEEGTELETGIDNHLSVTPTLKGSTLSWTLGLQDGAPAECAGVDPGETVHHFSVYASPVGDGATLTLLADDLAASTRSLDLSGKLGAGRWLVYVRAVGQPSITNQMSAPVTVTGSGGGGGTDAGTGGGDGCSGVPTITTPTEGESVGPAIDLRVSAPSCMQAMIAYIGRGPGGEGQR